MLHQLIKASSPSTDEPDAILEPVTNLFVQSGGRDPYPSVDGVV
jgi:hypothetical protein